MKLKTSGKWKSVELDPHLQAKGFAEGLLGIEELSASNYDIIGNKTKKAKDVQDIRKMSALNQVSAVNKQYSNTQYNNFIE